MAIIVERLEVGSVRRPVSEAGFADSIFFAIFAI